MLALDDDLPVPPGLQARVDALQGEEVPAEPREETSFRSLLVELDQMEQGLKTDFSDLPSSADDTEEEQGETLDSGESLH